MRHNAHGAAYLRISALLLTCAMVQPVAAQARPPSGLQASVAPSAPPRADVVLPDLPAADVTINPADLSRPSTSAPPGVSAALPSAQVPTRAGASPAAAAPKAVVAVAPRPAPRHPVSPTPDFVTRTGSTAPDRPSDLSTLSASPAGAPASPAGAPASPAGAPAQPAGAAVTPPMPAAPIVSSEPAGGPPPVVVAPPPAVVAPPATSAVLDPDTLHAALDAFVGPEPSGAHVPPQDLARFKDRQSIAAVYAARHYASLWIEDARFNAKARSALARIDHAAEDGLDLRTIKVAVPHGSGDAATLASAELDLTQAIVAYGRQATGGRVDPARIGALIAAKPDVADPARVLDALAASPDAGEALRDFNPPQRGYGLLRAKLAELRRSTDVATQTPIPYGPVLKPGMRDARVPLIRTRFGLDIPPSESSETELVYDTRVVAAVADFQRAHHLPASGVLTIRTIAALSGGNPRRLEAEIVANMERWRWLPRDLGEAYVAVNIPDFTLDVMHGDTVFHHARVVVGQPDKPTPVFSETMKFIIVNPYWNVPLSIVKKEMMPKLAEDPDYFTNHGYETVERDGITYVRQPPGEANALGRIKFMFPNKYAVYLHDTNARALFGNDRRALSHGCVRVEAPFKLAEAVLGRQNGWTEARVKRMVGGDERTINLPTPLPLHIVYFTAFVDDKGELQLRDDVYGYSGKLRAALGLDS